MRTIALECQPDEVLLKTLGYPRKRIFDQPSNSEVINYLRKNPGNIGVADEDRGSVKPPFFSKFNRETLETFGVESFRVPETDTRLIIIKPRLEEWVLYCTGLSEVKPQDFSFPNSGHEFKKVINRRLRQYENMIYELLRRGNGALLHLKQLIDMN